MSAVETIKKAYELLEDAGQDPRSAFMRELSQMTVDNSAIPAGNEIQLIATLESGGKVAVHDQHGRRVAGVQSVAAYKDQMGQDVLQINI